MQRTDLVKNLAKAIQKADNEANDVFLRWREEDPFDQTVYLATADAALGALAAALYKMPIDQDGEHDITTDLIDFFDGMDDEFDFGY